MRAPWVASLVAPWEGPSVLLVVRVEMMAVPAVMAATLVRAE